MWPGNPFGHPAWLEAHVDILEPDLVVERLEREGTGSVLIAHRSGGPVRLLGDRMSDRLDVADDLLDEVVRRAQRAGVPLRLGPVATSSASGLCERWPSAHLVEPTVCPRICFDEGRWSSYLDGVEARRRRRIVAVAERLLTGPEITVADAREPHEVVAATDDLIRLHRLRFGGRSASFDAPKDAFLRAALEAMAADGAVCIRTLRVAGAPAAALLCFETELGWWYYQAGWDPAFADRSVGRALFAHTVRAACDAGRGLLLLRGDEAYKAWWATHTDHVATVEIAW